MALMLGELAGVITLDDKPFEKGLDGAQSKLEGFGSKGKIVAAAAGVAIAGALAAGLVKAMDVGKANDKLAAQLGLNAKESEKAGKAAGKLYAGAYGDSMEDVNNAIGAVMSSIKGMRTASQADLESMTAKVLDLSAAFEIDAARAAQVAGQMITTGLAKDGVEAADLLAGSLQKVPAAVREDLLDAVDEYGPFMKNLGIKGSDAMGMLVSASEKGMYGIDKTGDALKEFGIRATDMSEATAGAYETLGMDQTKMTNALLAGGDTAKTAFGDIIHGLQQIKDPAQQSQAALALFGTPLEDLSVNEIPGFLGMVDPMGDAFDTMGGKAAELGKTLSDNASTKIESWKRTAEMAFIDILGGKVLPILENVGGFLGNTFGPVLGEIGRGVDAFGAAFSDAGTEVTSSGLAGFLERLGLGLGGIWEILSKGDFSGKLTGAFGWEEDSPIVGVLFNIRSGIEEVVGGVKAFTAAWAANDGEITSSGFPGFMEGLAYQLHQAFDYVKNTVLPALGNFTSFLIDNKVILIMLAAAVGGYALAMQTLSVISTVRGWIAAAAAAQWGLNLAMTANPIGLVVAGIAALVAGLIWFFTQTELGKDIVKNVWAFIQGAVKAVVDWFQNTAMPVIKRVFEVVGAVFKWLYENIVRPAFEGIKTVVNAAWLVIRGIFQVLQSIIRNVLGPVFQWLYRTVIKPVFDGIGAAIKWVWVNILKPTFDAWSSLFRNVLGPAFNWLWKTIIKPAFDGIGSAIKWVWENVLKPVFDTLMNFVKKTIPDAFDKGVGFVKTAWNKLQEIAKAPVRFVVDTVINDGLIGAFNTIAGILPDIDKLPRVALPPGFADGGYTGPGRKHDPAGIVHAGEVVFSQDDIRRHGGVGAVERMRRGGGDIPKDAHPVGMPGAFGGESPYYSTPKIDLMRNLGRAFIRPLAGIDMAGAARAWNNVSRLRVGLGNGVPGISSAWGALPSNIYAWTQFGGEQADVTFNTQGAFSGTSPAMKRGVAIHELGHAMGLPHVTSRPSVMHPYMQSSLVPTAFDVSNMRRIYGMPGAGQTPATLGDPKEGGGWNPIADIVDSLVKKFKESFTAGGIMADIAIGIGRKIIDSASHWVENMITGKGNESGAGAMSPTVYDGGGWLENTGGPQLVQHNKSKPDAVLSHDQWETMRRIAENTGNGITYSPQIQYMGEDPETLLRRDKHRFVDLLDAIA